MKLEFFERAVELVEKYRKPGQTVQQTFQTNGLLLDDAWCAFFKKHDFLVGLSVDGPRELHDAYRRDRKGQGTFDLVMRGGAISGVTASSSISCARSTPQIRRMGVGSTASFATSSARNGCSSSRSSSARQPRRSPSPIRVGATGPARESGSSTPRAAISSPTARSGASDTAAFSSTFSRSGCGATSAKCSFSSST